VSDSQIESDIRFLAGELPHRGPNTQNERAAAQYIHERLRAFVPDAAIDDFYSIENHKYLFAAYYGEFFFVAVIAWWFPRAALCYGAAVFLAYLAEFSGYLLLGRLLPSFETQNVAARVLAERPGRLFVVTAHYDSGKASFLSRPRVAPWLRAAHLTAVACMAMVVISCATDAVGLFELTALRYDVVARWGAVVYLAVAAALLLHCEHAGEFVPGAIGNASGVAVLLELARRFSKNPLGTADVWFVATGSKESWMNGIRHFVTTHDLDRETTYVLNVAHVGAGSLHYTTREGMLHAFPCSREMVASAKAVAAAHGALPCRLRHAPSDAAVALARGIKTMSIVGLDRHALPPHWNRHTDTPEQCDFDQVQRAADFAEAVLQRLSAEQ